MKIKSFTITNCFNTKNFGVPQNRERVYTVGHLRSRGRKQIFPLKGADGEDSAEVVQIGQRNRPGRDNLNQYRLYSPDGVAPCLNKMDGGGLEPHIPVQFGIDKNIQKDNGDESFTLTAQDRHGVALKVNDKEVYAVWYEKYNCYIAIRKLTPRECFRLQAWTDDYFEKAAFVNSDSQLYKQAGNGVTVDVVAEIAKQLSVKGVKP